MIRPLPCADRQRLRHVARRKWRTVLVPFAIVDIEGLGRSIVCMLWLETRWSDSNRRRLWRLPGTQLRRPAQ